ncbi:MAG: hypothetical protein ACRD63_04540, partial [Pyrinomonadaceae bacterium]
VFSTVPTGFFLDQFNNVTTSPYNGVVFNGRVDVKLNDKHNLFVRYSYDNNDTFAPVAPNTPPSYWRINANKVHNAQTGLTSIINAHVVNDFRINYQRFNNDSILPDASDCPPENIGCTGRGGAQVQFVTSNLRFGNNEFAPQQRLVDRYQFTDNVSWQKGAHHLRFGGEIEYDIGSGFWSFADPAVIRVYDPEIVLFQNSVINSDPRIPAPLKSLLTIPIPAAFQTPGAKITINDILQLPIAGAIVGLGDPAQPPSFNQNVARQSKRFRFYGQDSWTIRPGFTLNYGLSYLFETNLFNHDLTKPPLLGPLVSTLEPSLRDGNNIAPALGFAWDIGNKGKTVLRAGAGIYYDTTLFVTRLRERGTIGPAGNGRSQVSSAFYRNPLLFPNSPVPLPQQLQTTFDSINVRQGASILFDQGPTKFTAQNFLDQLASQNPLILGQLQQLGNAGVSGLQFFKTGTDILDPDNVSPYSEQFTLGIQHQFGNNLALTVDGVFRNSLHTPFTADYNLNSRAASLGGPVIPSCSSAQALDPAAQCSNGPLIFVQNGNREQYKALLVKLDRRFSNHFQFTASYAFSSLTGYIPERNLTNRFSDKVNLNFDARHRFAFSGVVDLPYGLHASLISVFSTRPPFDVRLPGNIDINGDGTTGDTLPEININALNRGIKEGDLSALVAQFNNEFAGKRDAQGQVIPGLILPPSFSFGDNFQSHDVRLSKTFRLRERYSIEGIVEVFNLFNNANLVFGEGSDQLDAVVTSGEQVFNFGRPTGRTGQAFGTGGPRA